MTAKTNVLALGVISAIGLGIYAISGGTGNEVSVEITKKSVAPAQTISAELKPLAQGAMAAMRILDKPLDMSTINFNDGAGKSLSIADWQGRTVLLNLWATWCPPCRHEMPSLEALEKQLGSDKFEVVTVSIDLKTADKPMAFFKETNLKALNFYWDGTAGIFNTLKKQGLAFGMPTTILIDKNGLALGALNGPADWSSPEAVAMIEKLL